jgi:hypothetical protein
MARHAAVVVCLAAAVILQLLLPAQAHMVMIEPKSRQWLDYTLRYNYNPHAVNGGGGFSDSAASTKRSCQRGMQADVNDSAATAARFAAPYGAGG